MKIEVELLKLENPYAVDYIAGDKGSTQIENHQ
jgi:hypothetical protein